MWNKVWMRRLLSVGMDVTVCVLAIVLSLILRFEPEGALPNEVWVRVWTNAPWIVGLHVLILWAGGTYRILWRLADAEEIMRLLLLGVAACVALLIINGLFGWRVPRSVLALTSTLTILSCTALRLFWRLIRGGRLKWHMERAQRQVMIVGAGEAGAYVANRYARDKHISLLFVDDDPIKQNAWIHNVQVRGTRADIPNLVQAFDVQEIIVAIPSLKGEAFSELLAICTRTKCHVRIFSELTESGAEPDKVVPRLRELNVSDFLSRAEVKLDTENILGYIAGKTVLVTGGGGSIGSEICRQVMRFQPDKLVIVDIYENNAYELLVELRRTYGETANIHVLIGSIREKARLEEIFEAHHPQVVFHAAAHKHVCLMEDSPAEAVKNNVFGTKNLLEVAASHHVERLVQLSTDKAVNPTNVMGATKRVTEMMIQLFAHKTDMKCMAVRFGNVLGSHGSVIPLFENQIKAGGPVTVTHRDITRYFMTIPEAAQLVLQAGALANNGAIYVLDMGEPVRIDDLARKMIRFYGYEPGEDMQIVYTGLRPGEKMHEELLMEVERDGLIQTEHEKIAIAPPLRVDEELLAVKLAKLMRAAECNNEQVSRILMEVVETYHPAFGEQAGQVSDAESRVG